MKKYLCCTIIPKVNFENFQAESVVIVEDFISKFWIDGNLSCYHGNLGFRRR